MKLSGNVGCTVCWVYVKFASAQNVAQSVAYTGTEASTSFEAFIPEESSLSSSS